MPPIALRSTSVNELRKLAWIRAGDEIEAPWKVDSLLAEEQRMIGPGTNTERWYLVVLRRDKPLPSFRGRA